MKAWAKMVTLGENKKGFIAIEFVAVVVVASLVIFAGWYVYKNQHMQKTANTYDSSGSSSSGVNNIPLSTSPKSTVSTQVAPESVLEPCPASSQYLLVKEWHIKLKLQDACRMEYDIEGEPNNAAAANADLLVSFIHLKFDSSVKTTEACRYPYTGSVVQVTAGDHALKVGEFYYGLAGGFDKCGDEQMDIVRERVHDDLTQPDFENPQLTMIDFSAVTAE